MLSKKTRYALQALIYLAERQDQGPILIHEISTEKQISKKFLENILLELRKAGILGSKKGKGGGYYLIKQPEDVTLVRVIRLLDGPVALLPCVSLNYYEKCDDCDEATCQLRKVMAEVRDETLKILRTRTLKDILPPKEVSS
ncbi:MAG: Rrf2 family transcriptional regulator [Bacteroidota bacterium]